MTTEYKTITEADIVAIEESIQLHQTDGWELLDGIIMTDSSDGNVQYTQNLIRNS